MINQISDEICFKYYFTKFEVIFKLDSLQLLLDYMEKVSKDLTLAQWFSALETLTDTRKPPINARDMVFDTKRAPDREFQDLCLELSEPSSRINVYICIVEDRTKVMVCGVRYTKHHRII